MPVPSRRITPAALVEARRLYEHTDITILSIATLLGVKRTTINYHARKRGWCRSDTASCAPRKKTAAGSAPASFPDATSAALAMLARGELVARLARQIEREIAAVERLVARMGRAPDSDGPADTERAARTLAVLVRTLRELSALERADPETAEEDAGRDADAYRRELAATLERLLAGGQA